MRKTLATATAILTFASLYFATPIRAQSGTESEITFTNQKKEKARQQLRRILSEYDLDPWIFTQEVRIKAGVDPHSRPILTLNTEYIQEEDDERKLSVFVHEQAHWFVYYKYNEGQQATIEALRQMYPDAPNDYRRLYAHLIVGWLELDGMTELIDEETARQIAKEEIRTLTDEPLEDYEKRYRWYNTRVLEDTQEIGAILGEHDMLITPDKGLVVEAGAE